MTSAGSGLIVEDGGLLTTVQDAGRWGYQHYGVSVSGAMDPAAHRRANRLVGNPSEAATLEITLVGPVLRFRTAARIGVSGAAFELRLDARAVSTDTLLHAEPGQTLAFGRRTAGARAYLAAAGGILVPVVLGSRSTHLRSSMGGLEGRALRVGDGLAVGSSRGVPRRESAAAKWGRSMPLGGARVRVLPGPHAGLFDPAMLRRLETARYTIRPESDRMGYRLERRTDCRARGSEPAVSGHARRRGPGRPRRGASSSRWRIARRSGGYPRVATVITADIPVLGQLAPGDWIEFQRCDLRTAREALVEAEEEREST